MFIAENFRKQSETLEIPPKKWYNISVRYVCPTAQKGAEHENKTKL